MSKEKRQKEVKEKVFRLKKKVPSKRKSKRGHKCKFKSKTFFFEL